MKKENTKALREGAMMVALTVILMLLNKYVPLFSVVGVFACGVPMAVLAARNGFKVVTPAVASVFLVAILIDGGILAAISTILMSVLPGAAAGYMLGKKRPFFHTLFAASFTVCVGWIFELLVLELFVGQGIDEMFAEIIQQMRTMMDGAVAALGKLPTENAETNPEAFAEELLKMLELTMRTYFPSIVVVSSMLSGYIVIRFSSFVIRRTKLAAVEVLPFAHLKAPKSLAVIAVCASLVYMFSDTASTFGMVLANIVFILYAILGVCGLSFVDYKFKTAVKSTPVRFLIYGAVMLFGGILMGIISNILIIIGILDSGRNFRGLESYDEQ